MRGEIRNREKYLAGKLLNHSAWAGILPRNITPSDGDMIFDNAGRFMFVELKGTTCDWAEIPTGQRRLFENLLTALGPASGSVAVLALHREPARVFEGKMTEWNLYKWTFYNRGLTPICLSDLSKKSLKECQEKLRQLTDTIPVRTMEHNSDACDREGIPRKFKTANPVIILTNWWDSDNEAAQALETRADCVIKFEPTPQEVHRQVALGGWFHDQIVFDFLAEHLHLISEPSFRHYTQASKQRKAGIPDWEAVVLEWLIGDEKMKQVALLLADKSIKTDTERAKKFEKLGYGTERTFWRLKKSFRWYDEPPLTQKIKLQPAPPKPDIAKLLAEAEMSDLPDGEGESFDEFLEKQPKPKATSKPKPKGKAKAK